ncbi:related to cholinesterase [Cephalotrichum gorgonifer]|uniref:Carboxylic ester hydrolase n=1 Tax=Cephalotrichum gorgonifer TaxID=2041049 RepID=A0AAE8N729_9PEZI|nr:related to cholinesterase [Cephalotrichum gorgonifer]
MRSRNVWAIVASAGLAAGSCKIPKVNEAGLTILSYNDLTNEPAADSAAVLVQESRTYSDFASICKELSETPWDPSSPFENGLNSSLAHQLYLENFPPTQLFWVAKDGSTCLALAADGSTSEVACNKKLPGLCTQNAPVSTSETADDPTDFRVNHTVGSVVYNGYRDHFVFKFRGIRFAELPPRFEHSTLFHPDESRPVDALRAGASCLQPIGEVESDMSEDCLFLNLWTPTLPPAKGVSKDKLKPVMLYIHGGGFTSGSSRNTNTDGTNLASRGDVVSIAVNYRVGSLGFLILDDGVHNGNYGIGDVVTALEWVRENVASFGGDPERVTIFGESAGAVLVRDLLASHRAKGLFSNAISQSGPAGLASDNEFGFGAYYSSLEYQYDKGSRQVVNETGCADSEDVLACLRAFNATEMVNLKAVANVPAMDGDLIRVTHLPLDGSGLTGDVAFLSGTNRNELGVDVSPLPEDWTVEDVLEAIRDRLGLDARPALDSGLFPLPKDPTPRDLVEWVVRVATDGVYTCMELATNDAAARGGAFADLYSFTFNRTYSPRGYTQPHCDPPATDGFPDGDPSREYLKCHAGEQMIVFGTIIRAGLPDRDGLDVPFMQLVMDYWASFAWTRNPNPAEAYLRARGYHGTLAQVEEVGEWEAAGAEGAKLRLLQWNGKQVEEPETAQCQGLGIPLNFWDTAP